MLNAQLAGNPPKTADRRAAALVETEAAYSGKNVFHLALRKVWVLEAIVYFMKQMQDLTQAV